MRKTGEVRSVYYMGRALHIFLPHREFGILSECVTLRSIQERCFWLVLRIERRISGDSAHPDKSGCYSHGTNLQRLCENANVCLLWK